ncbi:helix-turn-helix domain-containing protein [Shewanella gelidimarina]|uniref:helix-turn-helix domain-containing protein n=1 Tax=Shewanella gelidimarina TaxID=56813 RepID=UPI00200E792B|nr:helix-turn-helix transcriptional regulator [Shewanella gelidimarina]MCL1056797.1 helix-turn-helix domain-containing protein [Shewanella gelidimarina]
MGSFKLQKQTSVSTVIAVLLKQLRLYGAEYLLSGGDRNKAEQTPESQETVAKELNITKAAYSKIENGDVVIGIYHLSHLCIGYGISLGDFMGCVDEQTKKLQDDGIQVINSKITLRLDHIRWIDKISEKSEANFNKAIRELKKNKTYSLHSEKELEDIRLDCKKKAESELDKRYDLGEAISMQTSGLV